MLILRMEQWICIRLSWAKGWFVAISGDDGAAGQSVACLIFNLRSPEAIRWEVSVHFSEVMRVLTSWISYLKLDHWMDLSYAKE